MADTPHRDKHRSLFFGVAILVLLLIVPLRPVYGVSSSSKSYSSNTIPIINSSKQIATFTPSGPDSTPSSSTSSTIPQTPSTTTNNDSTIKTIASDAVITCINSTVKNALIDVLINRPLVNVNGSIRIDPTFVNHTMTDIMGCTNKIENRSPKWVVYLSYVPVLVHPDAGIVENGELVDHILSTDNMVIYNISNIQIPTLIGNVFSNSSCVLAIVLLNTFISFELLSDFEQNSIDRK